jgi:hypothetical protein
LCRSDRRALGAISCAKPIHRVGPPEIRAFVDDRLAGCDGVEAARRVFHFVHDEVSHSWDIQGRRVTRTALDDVLAYREAFATPRATWPQRCFGVRVFQPASAISA